MSESTTSEQTKQQSVTKPQRGVLGQIFRLQDSGFKRRLPSDPEPWDGTRIDSSPDMLSLMESVKHIAKEPESGIASKPD